MLDSVLLDRRLKSRCIFEISGEMGIGLVLMQGRG
jgi:hypothetical protein